VASAHTMLDGVDVQVAPKRERDNMNEESNKPRTELCGIPDMTFLIGEDSLVSNALRQSKKRKSNIRIF